MLNDGRLDIEGAVASGGPAVPPTQTAQKKDVALPQTPGSDDDKNEAEVRVQVVPTLGICPSPRESASICWTPDGALLFGGYSGELQASLSELWLLNFETTEWIQLQSEVDEAIPEPRAGHTGVMLGHSRMVCYGGINKSRFLSDTWVYDRHCGAWSAVQSARQPPARQGAAAEAVHGTVYLYGGSGREGLFNDLWMLTDAAVWNEVEVAPGVPWPLPCSDHVLARWGNDLLLVGGRLADPASGQPIWRLEPAHRRWSELDSQVVRRARHSAVVLNDAALLIAGGCADSPLDFAEPAIAVLDLRSMKWIDLFLDELDIYDSPSKRASASDTFYDFAGHTWVSPGSTAQRNDFNLVAVGPTSAWIWGGRAATGYCEPATWLIDLGQRNCSEIVDTPGVSPVPVGSPVPMMQTERGRGSTDSRDTIVDDDEGSFDVDPSESMAGTVFGSVDMGFPDNLAEDGSGSSPDSSDSQAARSYLTLDDLPREDELVTPSGETSPLTSGTSSLETLPEVGGARGSTANSTSGSPLARSARPSLETDGGGGGGGGGATLQPPPSAVGSITGRNASLWRRMSSTLGHDVVDDEVGEWVSGELLGRGAFGSVFKCMDRTTGTIFAGKRLNFAHLKEEDMRTLVKELRTLRRLSHPHVVSYRGYDASKTELWIFMDLCPGGDLHQSLKSFGGLSAALAARYTYQILLGLEYLHSNNVLHRDIKGANILLTISGQAKLSDFGLAAMLASESGKSSMFVGSEVVGSPYWMAPEVITGKGSKRASDIWSLGCTVFEMAHTSPPNSDMEPMAALFHVGSNRPMPEPPAQLGEAGVDFVKQCFRYLPTERPNCAALLDHAFLSRHRRASGPDAARSTSGPDDPSISIDDGD